MSQQLKVLLVEDDWSVRSAVRDYLIKRDMAVSEADCLEAALSAADAIRPDVAIVDIVLPERAGERANFDRHVGIEVARQLRERLPQVGIVFLSAYADRGPEVVQLFMDGHRRIVYLLKGSKPQELLDAIRKVAGDLSALEIASGVQTTRKTAFDLAVETLADDERGCVLAALDNLATLTKPEWRVFETVGQCLTYRQVAHDLAISVKTVDSHMGTIYEKLCLRGIDSRFNQSALLAKVYLLHCLHKLDNHSPGRPVG